jgi:DUF971 family protein
MGTSGRLDTLDQDQLPEDELTLHEVGLIGHYAVQISFRSGHGSGIYTFDYLRKITSR